MRVTRIHVPGALVPGADIELPAQAAEHVTRVLRLEPGAVLTLFNGDGGECEAKLAPRVGKRVLAHVVRHAGLERESPLDITLLQGVARGERMDLIVQKATELGVSRILPVLTERSVVKVDSQQRARKREHWQAIAISACEQSGRNRIPHIGEPAPTAAVIAALPADGARFLLAAGGAQPLAAAARGITRVALFIGPEGGLAESERTLAFANGFVDCRMGPRILRTETAGLTALAILQTITGDLAT
jgi:16S rRNA (uracil1498-N3)-methyltransferase